MSYYTRDTKVFQKHDGGSHIVATCSNFRWAARIASVLEAESNPPKTLVVLLVNALAGWRECRDEQSLWDRFWAIAETVHALGYGINTNDVYGALNDWMVGEPRPAHGPARNVWQARAVSHMTRKLNEMR